MSKLVSVGLIAAAMFANPAMAAWYDKNGAVVHPRRSLRQGSGRWPVCRRSVQ
jgi:hypothetical protein